LAPGVDGVPIELEPCLRWGVNWSKEDWVGWVPAKQGASTTGIGHYMDPNDVLSYDLYKEACSTWAIMGTPLPANALAQFTSAGKPYTLEMIDTAEPHPYAHLIKGPIFLPDEYETDTFDAVVTKIKAQVGVEIGPQARLFHFHLLLDIKHLSKLALDQGEIRRYFTEAWAGTGSTGTMFQIKDIGGNPWMRPSERLYVDIKLLAEDNYDLVLSAYVQKELMGFRNAAMRELRRKEHEKLQGQMHVAATANAQFLIDTIVTDENASVAHVQRRFELPPVPAGQPATAQHTDNAVQVRVNQRLQQQQQQQRRAAPRA